jgi:hypothetical protein
MSKIKEVENYLNGYLTEVLPGGCWNTYTEPKVIAEGLIKLLNLHDISIAERKLNAMIEVVDFFDDTANTNTRATMCDIINRI